ncbi:Cof-type HAD-IIB family hydrolase [Thalassobacillus sp. CUG 92003]|uniref:Cof-type HAD-IIB family hydrolase n=1 Tax=Thalassobacillus sp. CUG 92003 TaxID=2736641 RepID=UPI0015E75E25|nr:Cof-type HAD-IIB family hydrolase [Thalassobacillus sp. CUG 92003]
MAQIVAIDLDGTLLTSSHTISRKNIEAIEYAQSLGIEVVIATGRAHFDVLALFKDTGIRTWIIGANGATIHKPDGTLFASQPIEKHQAIESLKWLEEEDYYYEVFSNDHILTPLNRSEILEIEIDRITSANPDINPEPLYEAIAKQNSQTGFAFINSYLDIAESEADVFNILAFSFSQEKLDAGWKKFHDSQDLTIVSSADHNFELEHRAASKGNALAKLADELKLDLSEAIAFGDSHNDLSMISEAGQGIAMANAVEAVQLASDKVTASNDEHGVARILFQLHGSDMTG